MRRLPLLALALLASACPPRVTYPECKVDEDCADHAQVCAGGFCKECREDAQCAGKPDRPLCRDAVCAQCGSNKDCAAGQKCAQSKCVPECTEATAAQDCGEGHKCLSGRCSAEEECVTDADCSGGKACVESRCVQGGILASRSERLLGQCEVKAVYFGFDESTLSQEARHTLDQDWDCLQKTPFHRALVAGHTDERGTTEYNLALGMRRADAVRRYLVGLGAEPRKLKPVSYGKERPADPAHGEAAWAKNRRVEIAPEP